MTGWRRLVARLVLFVAIGTAVALTIRWGLSRVTVHTLGGHRGPVWAVAFAPDGRSLASIDQHGTVRRWELATGRMLSAHRLVEGSGIVGLRGVVLDMVTPAAFDRDARRVALVASNPDGSWGETVTVWDVDSGRRRAAFEAPDPPSRVLIAPDGVTVGAVSYGHIMFWDSDTGQVLGRHRHAWGSFARATMIPTYQGFAMWGGTRTLVFRSVTGDALDTSWTHPGYNVISLAYSANGRTLLLGTRGGHRVELWDLGAPAPRAVLRDGPESASGRTTRALLAADGRTLASVYFAPGIPGNLYDLLDCGGTCVSLWDLPSGTVRANLRHGDRIRSMAFSPDGATLATGGESEESSVKIWRVRSWWR